MKSPFGYNPYLPHGFLQAISIISFLQATSTTKRYTDTQNRRRKVFNGVFTFVQGLNIMKIW